MIKPQIVNKLKSINELQLLTYLETEQTWTHNKYSRHWVSECLLMAEITIKKSLKSLVDKGFITKPSKGVYTINKEVIQ